MYIILTLYSSVKDLKFLNSRIEFFLELLNSSIRDPVSNFCCLSVCNKQFKVTNRLGNKERFVKTVDVEKDNLHRYFLPTDLGLN